jgi:hypothetical protein
MQPWHLTARCPLSYVKFVSGDNKVSTFLRPARGRGFAGVATQSTK